MGTKASLVRKLYLLRHATPAYGAPGVLDHDRPLAETGRRQAILAGQSLAANRIDMVLCSTALRAVETASELKIPVAPIKKSELYNASAMRIRAVLARVPEYVTRVLVVAHSPGIPDLVRLLANNSGAHRPPEEIRYAFPPGTLVGLEFADSWSDLHQAQLFLAERFH